MDEIPRSDGATEQDEPTPETAANAQPDGDSGAPKEDAETGSAKSE